MDGYVFTSNNGQWITAPINTGTVTGNTNYPNVITIPTNNWVPGGFTITIGGSGGGGGGAIAAPALTKEAKAEEKKKDKGGCSCKKCKEFFEYAEPNQEDGTLVCWSCRHGY